jgi:hypothetical protein
VMDITNFANTENFPLPVPSPVRRHKPSSFLVGVVWA